MPIARITVDLDACNVNERKMLADIITDDADALKYLSKDKYIDVRMKVAHNKATSKEILTELAKDVSLDVRYAVARNPNTPAELFIDFADDSALCIRQLAAEDIRTPEAGLIKLIIESNFSINEYLARNPNITPDMEKVILHGMRFDWEKKSWHRTRKKYNLE